MNTTDLSWNQRADLAQHSLDHFFGTARPQFLENSHPAGTGDSGTFNYWWLAHVIDVRVDAWERTGERVWLDRAQETADNIVERNGGSLFNDYFDDMLWFGLALLRLHSANGSPQTLDAALEIWDHVVEHGWNDSLGESLAWRKQQLAYKNTPANGPLVILSLRLERELPEGTRDFRRYAVTAFDWIERNLLGEDGFVEDGINREGDGKVDTHWRFTYNQGLYIGAAVELFQATGEKAYLDRATRTALVAIVKLSDGSVFRDEGDGGDEGLFKGVYYRYLGELLPRLEATASERRRLESFVRSGTDALWDHGVREGKLRPGNDWGAPFGGPIPYSTELSAIMATELRARLEEVALSA